MPAGFCDQRYGGAAVHSPFVPPAVLPVKLVGGRAVRLHVNASVPGGGRARRRARRPARGTTTARPCPAAGSARTSARSRRPGRPASRCRRRCRTGSAPAAAPGTRPAPPRRSAAPGSGRRAASARDAHGAWRRCSGAASRAAAGSCGRRLRDVELEEVEPAHEDRRVERVDVRAVGEREPLALRAGEAPRQRRAVAAGLLVGPLAGEVDGHADPVDEAHGRERVGDLRHVVVVRCAPWRSGRPPRGAAPGWPCRSCRRRGCA